MPPFVYAMLGTSPHASISSGAPRESREQGQSHKIRKMLQQMFGLSALLLQNRPRNQVKGFMTHGFDGFPENTHNQITLCQAVTELL